jgi:hypothetical protein
VRSSLVMWWLSCQRLILHNTHAPATAPLVLG